jgi:hypothetical protein
VDDFLVCYEVVQFQMLCDMLIRSECMMVALLQVRFKGRWFRSRSEDPLRVRFIS